MQNFTRLWNDCLFAGVKEAQDRGWCYLYISNADRWESRDAISLDEAVLDSSHGGCFLFAREEIKVGTVCEAEKLIGQIRALIRAAGDTDRYIFWIENAVWVLPETTAYIGLNGEASQITIGLKKQLIPELFCVLANGGKMVWQKDALAFSGNARPSVRFEGNRAVGMSSVNEARIHFGGAQMGCVSWKCYMSGKELNRNITPSFRYLYTKDQSLCRSLFSFWNQEDGGGKSLNGFYISMDFTDVKNQYAKRLMDEKPDAVSDIYSAKRCFFSFLGWNNDRKDTVLKSYFQTIYGKVVYLKPQGWQEKEGIFPGRFVFVPEGEEGNWMEPDGDFLLRTDMNACRGSEAKEICLLCGLSGTEFIRIWEGGTLRFWSGMPAYADKYPVHPASIVGESVDLSVPLLDSRYTTSWLAVSGSSVPEYVSQPRGDAYYGNMKGEGKGEAKEESFILNHDLTGIFLNFAENLFFPCVPYAGYVKGAEETIQDYEYTILAAVRKCQLASSIVETLTHMENEMQACFMQEDGVKGSGITPETVKEREREVTTSGGQLVTKSQEGVWKKVTFANNQIQGKLNRIYLEQPHILMRHALESSSLFLVVANCDYLGELTKENKDIGKRSFHNRINVEDWIFSIKPGMGSGYNEYRNIMIIKGRKGKLYDPSLETNGEEGTQSLVANPSMWTNGEAFAAPWSENTGAGDAGQMVNLSTWLVQYCKEAYKNRENKYFEYFCRIMQDPEWQGVLFLNVSVEAEGVPAGLQGLLAGIQGNAQVCLHHLGIKSSNVAVQDGSIVQDGSSALFGLIYFQNTRFNGVNPVPPGGSGYEFQLLELKILFENSAVKKFESYAQLTLSQLFGLRISSMKGNAAYNSILLSGVYQDDNGSPSYHLKNISDSTCLFEESFLHSITIKNVNLTTVDADAKKYCFLLDGCIDFAIPDEWRADLFSFGSEEGSGEGLEFQRLAIYMQEGGSGQELSMETGQIFFNTDKSMLRKNSLYDSMGLNLEGMICAKDGEKPSDFGYLDVMTEFAMDELGEDWYGLVFGLNMGSLGELAGKVGIMSKLLLAFSSREEGKENQKVSVGIKLPGSGKADFLSLQNMLSLSVRQIWLLYDEEKESFFLIFDDIALKLLGLLTVPPSGSTMLYIFGDNSAKEGSRELGWYAVYRKEEKKQGRTLGKGISYGIDDSRYIR